MKHILRKTVCLLSALFIGLMFFKGMWAKASEEKTIYDASVISPDGSYSGRLEDDGEDFYKVVLNKSGKIVITVSMDTGWGNFYCFDNEYNQLGSFGIDYNSNRACCYKKQNIHLSAGTYYFKFSGDKGPYSFSLNFQSSKETFAESQVNRNDILNQAVSITLDKKYTGQLGYGDEQDFYKFSIPFSGQISISHCNYTSEADSDYELLDIEGNELYGFDGDFDRNKGYAHSVNTFSLKAGSYYLKVFSGWENQYGFYNFIIKIKPDPTQISQAKRKKTKATVTIAQQSGATGYILQYSTSEKFSKATTKTKTSKSRKISLTGLKKSKTYYLRAKSYKDWNGKTYYGDYGEMLTLYTY